MSERVKKIFMTVNQVNSSMGIQCIAPEKCRSRHTPICNNCKNNIGEYKEKDFYEPR